jgi:hypothetical protein
MEMKEKLIIVLLYGLIFLGIVIGGVELPFQKEGNITPENGPLYTNIQKVLMGINDYNYTYKIDLKTNESMAVKLEILDPISKKWLDAGTQNYGPNQITSATFDVNFAELGFAGPFLGKTKYRLNDTSSNKTIFGSSGPNILVNFGNDTAQKIGKNRYDYSVEVRSLLRNLYVYIRHANSTDGTNWSKLEFPKNYISNNASWETLRWENLPYYHKVEFVVDLQKLKYELDKEASNGSTFNIK